MKRCSIEDIKEWHQTFERVREIQDVIDKGFDGTRVEMKDGSGYFCNWRMKEFEKRYNKHFNKLLKQDKKEQIGEGLFVLSNEDILNQFQIQNKI